MKIAIMIQCHANPKQINLLLQRLRHPAVDCFVHIAKKAAFSAQQWKQRSICFAMRMNMAIMIFTG